VRVAHSAWYRGDIDAALALGREGLDGCLRAGKPRSVAQALGLMGDLEFERGAHEEGLDLLEQSARAAADCGFRWWQARMLLRLAKRAHQIGRESDSRCWACASLRIAKEISDRRRIVQALDVLSSIAATTGDWHAAGRLRGAIEAEVARRPLSAWIMSDLPLGGGPAFQRAREAGRLLALDRAANEALESHGAPADPSR
jgi:hypothetical protein